MYYQGILFLSIITISHASVVKFLPSSSFDLPFNFKDGKLPCSKETVVFPETLLSSIKLKSETSISGLILPIDGEICLDNVTINFGSDLGDVNCTHDGNVYFMERAKVSWSQPDVWSSPRFNIATPDAERVPCFDDIVEFSSDAEFTLVLPDRTQFLSGLKLDSNSFTTQSFKVLALTINEIYHLSIINFILNKFMDTGLRIEPKSCMSRAGCPCQKFPMEIDCEAKFCSVPTCVNPIKPIGHCCKICGGFIDFDIDQSFDLMAFKELVKETVESYGMDSLVYHIGRLPPNKVQLVIVDKSDYSGMSAEVVNAIDHQMQRHWVQGAKSVDISGSPLYKSGLGGKIFVSMFFMVVFVMCGIYVYYYKMPAIPDVRFLNLTNNTTVFSRFQTRTDSVVCLTRRDSGAPIGRVESTAFRNPLYDSTRRREVEDDAVSDE